MSESEGASWLVIDGYEDEPAAFGVPPYVGFHIRYICGVLEQLRIPYEYCTIDSYRLEKPSLENRLGVVVLAGAIVPGKYLRGAPISLRETRDVISKIPGNVPILCGGWAIRGWRQQGWSPLRQNLFLALQDTDATLAYFLTNDEWKHQRRNAEQWTSWAHAGARSKAVTNNPDLNGPLTYEVEVYQGCVRYKRGCKFCIEPKKGVPIWRTPEDIIQEVSIAHDMGVEHVRLGGMTDTYTYMAEGVVEMEYPRPNPEPIAKLLHGLREDERLGILHTDNGNPSIIAEHLEESEMITKTLVETLSDGAVLSFGLESADPNVHEANWLNCDSTQLKSAISLINKHGRVRGERGLPKLLPGLNFIAGLNGETSATYDLNINLLREIKHEGHMIRRVNIRQVEGEGFQEIDDDDFRSFKTSVREEFDGPLLEEMLPKGTILNDVWWESHDGRTRLPRHLKPEARDSSIHGKAGITFGRQIGAYPILIGMNYLAPLESYSQIMVTGHGARSITGIETGMDWRSVSEKQLAAIPGISAKGAWSLIGSRAKSVAKNRPFGNYQDWFDAANVQLPNIVDIEKILS
ncbi:MAG: radical SAM protein [Euryarchaeota archaeon]|nr:radical SAM protein [Euryarchaeota archaeon]|tara:strand:+ start:2510 stop:4240 length:1731 start_codon:yes stop_codon:yes gene_type:complete